MYLEPDKIVPLTDYWAKFRDAYHQSIRVTGYPTEKNLELLKTIVGASSDAGDLVLDPFCGSGTTLQAAHELDRRWIGIDESFAAIRATLGRLRHGVEAMGDYVEKAAKRSKQAQPRTLFEDDVQEKIDFSLYVDSEVLSDYLSESHELVEK